MNSPRPDNTPKHRTRSRALQLLMPAIALGSVIAVWSLQGPDAARNGALNGASIVIGILPKLILGILLAGFAQVLIPREMVARWLGTNSGVRGLLLATVAGTINVGGPMTSFPMLVVLARAGADFGVLVSFLTAWSLLGLQRILIWEISLMGGDFTLLRILSCFALPLLAGLIARHIVGPPQPTNTP